MIYLFLANGFEEIEALATVDILRRAEIPVKTVGVGTVRPTGTHGITVEADLSENDIRTDDISGVILPGGMPGASNLAASASVKRCLAVAKERGLLIAAICASPAVVLGQGGFLNGKTATCYPGFENRMTGAVVSASPVVTDGNITTAKGAGVTVDFALELVARLTTPAIAEKIRSSIQCP